MFVSDPVLRTAHKDHKCTWCAESITKGEQYHYWTSVDDSWSVSKMHPECFVACHDELAYWGDNEYSPYDNERPNVDGRL